MNISICFYYCMNVHVPRVQTTRLLVVAGCTPECIVQEHRGVIIYGVRVFVYVCVYVLRHLYQEAYPSLEWLAEEGRCL